MSKYSTLRLVEQDDNNNGNRAQHSPTKEQIRNAKRVMRKWSQGKPVAAMPDVGAQFNQFIPDLAGAFNNGGVDGFNAACEALLPDFPVIEELRKESPYKFLDVLELLSLPDQEYLIEDWLYDDCIAVVYGLPACNKSFIVIDWMCHVANGWEWHGHKTKRCRVLYVAAEGASGYKRRMSAWAKDKNWDHPEYILEQMQKDILFMKREVMLGNKAAVDDFIEEALITVEDAEEETGEKLPLIVVVDTVFQCSAGMNLNQTDVMTALTGALKDIKRELSATCVIAVHHSGKERERGMSGNIALKANVDMAYFVEAADDSGLTKMTSRAPHGKTKDDEGQEIWLQRRQVVYDPSKKLGNSCVMDIVGKPQTAEKENKSIAILREFLDENRWTSNAEWQRRVADAHQKPDRHPLIPRSTFMRLINEMMQMGLIEQSKQGKNTLYRLTKPGRPLPEQGTFFEEDGNE